MLIWINGAFGAGKTQAAYELQRRLPNSFVYDPENIGFFLQKNIPPSIHMDDFQDYSMWRTFNLDILDYCLQRHAGPVIVPMTITNKQYYNEVIGILSKKFEVRHIILCAGRETLLRRLASRFETPRSWAARQIDRCMKAFEEDITGYRIDTDDMNIYQVVEEIASLAGIALAEDDRSICQRFFDRIITQCRHIR
ncbi:MAG: AAA family ATPase [Lachnospiraceae bacterium]|nr:AAA family ATPase [Lachnospiraceae bacterium]